MILQSKKHRDDGYLVLKVDTVSNILPCGDRIKVPDDFKYNKKEWKEVEKVPKERKPPIKKGDTYIKQL